MGLYVLFWGVYCLLLIGASFGKSDNRKVLFDSLKEVKYWMNLIAATKKNKYFLRCLIVVL